MGPPSGSSSFSILLNPAKHEQLPQSLPVKKRGRPFKNPQEADTPKVKKKRGRPVKIIEEGGADSSSSDPIPKKKGRPFKVPPGLVSLPPPNPIFHPFFCEWKNCPAELHNLETLRNHLFNVHVKALHRNHLTCSWAKCGNNQGDTAAPDATNSLKKPRKDVVFETRDALRNHIQEAHLVSFAWHMGDGPKSTSLELIVHSKSEREPKWLFDANGKQVTPLVADLPVEDGHPRENNSRRFMKKREGLHVFLVPKNSNPSLLKVGKTVIPSSEDESSTDHDLDELQMA